MFHVEHSVSVDLLASAERMVALFDMFEPPCSHQPESGPRGFPGAWPGRILRL